LPELNDLVAEDANLLLDFCDSRGLAITGVSFDEDTLRWPWRERLALVLNAREPGIQPVTISFDEGESVFGQFPGFGGRLEVVADSGSSVVARVLLGGGSANE